MQENRNLIFPVHFSSRIIMGSIRDWQKNAITNHKVIMDFNKILPGFEKIQFIIFYKLLDEYLCWM